MMTALGSHSRLTHLGASTLCLLLAACTSDDLPNAEPESSLPATYVGSETCKSCHEDQFADWQASQHFRAMQPAIEGTVVGNFNDSNFKYGALDYTFFTRDEKFFVRADASNGDLTEFEISHTFGIEPLQQYLVSFPDGRRQALSVAWDTRASGAGGQRWFHLYPDEQITHDDELHWTGRNQNWNFMCADCHSTDLRKNYELANNTYDTAWAEISVGCEACHGPGSAHIDAAQRGDKDAAGLAANLASQKVQIDTCARCHSRRGIIAEGFEPGDEFLDYYRPALLDAGLYHADGQILDEVYVYGSFLQSKMHQKGVRCTDCHNPHDAELLAIDNGTCTRCHQNEPPGDFPTLKATAYDSPEHHFHPPDSTGAQCVNCHMVAKNYMVVDPRRDHSFRIPRPGLTETLGVPNACNGCHEDQTAAWAAAEISKRSPSALTAHYGEAIAAGRERDADASSKLAALSVDASAPAIVRGTALSLLDGNGDSASLDALAAGLKSDAPLVRYGAINGIRSLEDGRRWQFAEHLLDDPLLAIRVEVAVVLAPLLESSILQSDRERLLAAIREYTAAQLLNADRPEALTNLGGIYAVVGDTTNAERAYQLALDLDSDWLPALVNLADFYRAQGREAEAQASLDRARSLAPDNADVRFAYGLALVRAGRSGDALAELRKATSLSPENPRYVYVYGVALNSEGQTDDAVAVLEAGHEKFPGNADILFALATMERDRGHTARALEHANTLLELRPGDQDLQALVRQLRSAVSN